MIIPRHKICDICKESVGINKRYYIIKSKCTYVGYAGSCSDNRKHHICEDCMASLMSLINEKEKSKPDTLISREALKEELEKYRFAVVGFEGVLSVIDNAPTVDPCYRDTSCLDCKNYDKEKHNCPRFCEVIRDAIKERR